jgi:serine protease Do
MTLRQNIVLGALLGAIGVSACATAVQAGPSKADTVETVQPKIVKIYGAGGFRGLEAYQSGMLISSTGHVLTVWSYVLDTDYITVTLHDGRKFQADLVGADPRLEIAVLKIDAEDVDYFAIDDSVEVVAGARVLAFSNLYGVATGNEPTSVLHGSVSVKTTLSARRGTYKTPYRGPVYVLDAMTNNPGAAGGALTDRRGRLVGLLGKELRNSLNNTWLNFAVPMSGLSQAIADIRAGKARPRIEDPELKPLPDPLTTDLLGLVMVPDVLHKTPPFIEFVRRDSPATKAKLLPDDLVLFVNDRMVQSCKSFKFELSLIDRDAPVHITVVRDEQLLQVQLQMVP